MTSASRYFHTLRYLRPVQIVNRIWRSVKRIKPDLTPAPKPRASENPWHASVTTPDSMVALGEFEFLNEKGTCADQSGWNHPLKSKLWLYNLHYFDDLRSLSAAKKVDWHADLIHRWVEENPPGHGQGWEPYTLSRRIVNWVFWTAATGEQTARMLDSLATQVRWLERSVEYHILGNHLFANGKALVFAGLFFEGAEAQQWYRQGRRIVDRQLEEQVLSDGGHFELSPMYHAIVLEDLLDIINVHQFFGQPGSDEWLSLAQRMFYWLHCMSHPDDSISFFNDAAFGIAATNQELRDYAERLGLPVDEGAGRESAELSGSGYVRAVNESATLICDCAAVGPDYQPGHAHADTLSFELSLFGKRLIVNSGTSDYGTDAERQRQRGTLAHNTVSVDGADSSEVWAGFRVARRAKCTLHHVGLGETSVIEASHNGFLRLPSRSRHRRAWHLAADELRISDRVSGASAKCEARFHLHPEAMAEQVDPKTVRIQRDGASCLLRIDSEAATVNVESGSWHPEFGVSVENRVISAVFRAPELMTRLSWAEAR